MSFGSHTSHVVCHEPLRTLSCYLAEFILDATHELGDEYKDLLLMKVMDQSGIINPDEIEIPELLRLDMREKESLKTDKRTWQKKKMVGAISLVGLLYALIGLILLMFSQTKELHSYNIEIFALIVSFMGLFVTLYTYIFNIFFKLRKTNKNQMITVSLQSIQNPSSYLDMSEVALQFFCNIS